MNKREINIVSFILGVCFIIFPLLELFFAPCPSNAQLFMLRTTISLGAGLLAFLINGFITFKYQKLISAGGGFALFALTYIFTPSLFNTTDACNEPFTFSVYIRESNGKIPLANEGKLNLLIDGGLMTADLEQQGDCTFKNIPAKFRNAPVRFELNAQGWQFNNHHDFIMDSLNGFTKTLIVENDSTLCCLAGYVEDQQGQYLDDATISVEGENVLTDQHGYFEIVIPPTKRKKVLKLIVTKPGFVSWDHAVLPADKNLKEIVLSPK